MPVGTRGTVKGLTGGMIRDTGASMILGNTFHLMSRPGEEVVAALGGLHRFMAWDGPILVDSGGFQAWSIPGSKFTDSHVEIRDPTAGHVVQLTPELVVRTAETLGADIAMPLDHCPPWPCTEDDAARSVDRTLRWLERSLAARTRDDIAVFGIVQGSVFPEQRRRCAEAIASLDLPGNAIGGVSVGEPGKRSRPAVAEALSVLPEDRPRYLMGVGEPRDLLEAVSDGLDLFDCVLPTRNARNAQALTRTGPLNMRNAAHVRDDSPLDAECGCLACRKYSRGVIRHLVKCNELLGHTLMTLHNLTFIGDLMADARAAILEGTFTAWRDTVLDRYEAGRPSKDAPDAQGAG
jgi:queuine tRNA-ribosyltransferase